MSAGTSLEARVGTPTHQHSFDWWYGRMWQAPTVPGPAQGKGATARSSTNVLTSDLMWDGLP